LPCWLELCCRAPLHGCLAPWPSCVALLPGCSAPKPMARQQAPPLVGVVFSSPVYFRTLSTVDGPSHCPLGVSPDQGLFHVPGMASNLQVWRLHCGMPLWRRMHPIKTPPRMRERHCLHRLFTSCSYVQHLSILPTHMSMHIRNHASSMLCGRCGALQHARWMLLLHAAAQLHRMVVSTLRSALLLLRATPIACTALRQTLCISLLQEIHKLPVWVSP